MAEGTRFRQLEDSNKEWWEHIQNCKQVTVQIKTKWLPWRMQSRDSMKPSRCYSRIYIVGLPKIVVLLQQHLNSNSMEHASNSRIETSYENTLITYSSLTTVWGWKSPVSVGKGLKNGSSSWGNFLRSMRSQNIRGLGFFLFISQGLLMLAIDQTH